MKEAQRTDNGRYTEEVHRQGSLGMQIRSSVNIKLHRVRTGVYTRPSPELLFSKVY